METLERYVVESLIKDMAAKLSQTDRCIYCVEFVCLTVYEVSCFVSVWGASVSLTSYRISCSCHGHLSHSFQKRSLLH